jgi:capsular exopolysaccharide synthesis family protein
MNKPSTLPASVTNHELQRVAAHARDVDAPALPRVDVSAYVRTLLARKKLFLGVTLLLAVPSVLVISQLTPIYRATSVILVEGTKSKVVSIDELYSGANPNREYFQTQAEQIRSRDVALRVIRDLNLVDNPLFSKQNGAPFGGLSRLTASVDGGAPPDKEPIAFAEARVLELLHAGLSVTAARTSQLIQVSFDSPDPAWSAKIANAIVDAYIRSDLDARLKMTQTASSWLGEQLESLRTKLDVAEQRLHAYRDRAGLVSSRGSAEGGNARQLEELSQRLVQARVVRAQVEETHSQLRPGAPNRLQVPAVFNNPVVIKAREAESAAEAKLSDLRQRVGVAHPLYLAAQAELETAKRDLERQVNAVIASVEREYEAAKATERTLEASIARSRGAILDINRKQGELETLEREAATDRQLYQTFLARVKETSATADLQTPVARVVDPAIVPVKPAQPHKQRLAALAIALSALFAAFLTIVRDRRVKVVRTSDEVESLLGVPLLAAVPITRKASPSEIASSVLRKPNSLFAESIRTACTGTQLALLDVEHPIVMFGSSVPGEGKSTLALNFAIEQARNRKVLVIDADLRRPSIGKLLGLPSDSPGLADLVRRPTPEEAVQRISGVPGLSVIAGRESFENPLDIFADPRYAQALAKFRPQYGLIVIDSPPIELVSDAMLLARHVDAIVFVVRAAETPVAMVRRGLAKLDSAGAPILGIVLNAHDFERAGRYYGDTSAHTRYNYTPKVNA